MLKDQQINKVIELNILIIKEKNLKPDYLFYTNQIMKPVNQNIFFGC